MQDNSEFTKSFIEKNRRHYKKKVSDTISTGNEARVRSLVTTTPKEKIASSIIDADEAYNTLLKQAIFSGRIDVLTKYVLGYEMMDFHKELLLFQNDHPHSLQMVFRGAGKTTILSVVKSIWYLCMDPELRILIVSKTSTQAKSILSEIKHQLQFNDILISLFGNFAPSSVVDPNVVWNEREVNIKQRTKITKESSLTALGAESAVVGKHYDVAIIDDLIDEDNSRTPQQRDRIKNFYYKTLDPCLEPADDEVFFRGERHIIGTRYHPEDLYGHLKANELKEHTQIIPALTEIGQEKDGAPVYSTPWPQKFSIDYFTNKRKVLGSIIFDSQFQCDIELMRGEVFKPEWFDHDEMYYEAVPPKARVWTAADLAISPKRSADKFALVTVAIYEEIIYLIDYTWGRFGFNEQTKIIGEKHFEYDPIRTGVEATAYQASQIQNLSDKYPELRRQIVPIYNKLDKLTRAWKLTSIFESKLVRVKRAHMSFINHMIGFRDRAEDDLFDAFEMAVALATRGVRKRREYEPGVF